jgi:diguanylate cyclase (GGDEF)-like protein
VVVLADLDHFKSINDRFGHAVGDSVLELFTEAARKSVRSTDLLGRIGGEEFAAVLCDTSRERAVAVADRIRESFALASKEADGRPLCATVSIGVAYCDQPALDVPEMLAQADQALYFAKENGRNRVEVASLEMIMERRGEASAAPSDSVAAVARKTAAA